jgi:hypothetical protein
MIFFFLLRVRDMYKFLHIILLPALRIFHFCSPCNLGLIRYRFL